jgi:uncharacterized protein YecE (DUF72 family)
MIIGTSGWSYKEWIGPFYSESKGMLTQYAKTFQTVEVDSSFYRYPEERMAYAWARRSPPGFKYALKIPRLITHDKKFDPSQGIMKDLRRFLDIIEPLKRNGKLGPLLFQMPPSYHADLDQLESVLTLLPEDYQYAIEFRHRSWLQPETWSVLRDSNVAYTIVDEPLLPPDIVLTSKDFTYVRWHGRGESPWYNYNYSEEELQGWLPKVKEIESKSPAVYGYFNNHFHGFAVANALQLTKMLGRGTQEQEGSLRKVLDYLKHPDKNRANSSSESSSQKSLSEFLGSG